MQIPACPNGRHKGSLVVRAGWYGREGQRRQRWWCTPKSGVRHRFTETLPRIVTAVADQHACAHCATKLEPWEGQPAPRLYGFTARHVAKALVHVAGGSSYRSTADHIRTLAGRELSRLPSVNANGDHLPPPNQHGQLVSDWVQVFAPVIWAAYAPTTWPERVILDEDQFRFSKFGTPRGQNAFYVLASYGYQGHGRPLVTSVEAVPRLSAAAWARHLTRLDGTPVRVLTDGGRPVMGGAAKAWPGVEMRRCEYHLGRNLMDVMPERVRENQADELRQATLRAQHSVANWGAYLALLHARADVEPGFVGAVHRSTLLDSVIRNQAATRSPVGPHSTGPLETFFRSIELSIGDRAAKMTNKPRADALLQLLTARHNGWVDEDAWMQLIRDHLAARKGHATHQRLRTDPISSPSLR